MMKKTWTVTMLSLLCVLGIAFAQDTGGAETGGSMIGETGGSETGGAMMSMDNLTVMLEGSNEVPPVDTAASGEVTATLDGNTLTIDGSFEGLSSDLMEVAGTPAHIHQAAAGENGDVILKLDVQANDDNRSGTLSGTFDLTDEQLAAYQAGNLYVNVHSQDHPGGEIRAQLSNMGGMMNGETGGSMMGTDTGGSETGGGETGGSESGGG
ncbi:hypothetical protein BH24DEI2_BH24DEI2_14150 [soil metagenome]